MSDYKLAFNNETVIDREFPSELIRFIINDNFDSGICTYTTSIDSLRNYINIVYEFDDTIVEYKESIFKLYFLFELAKKIDYNIILEETSLVKSFKKLYNLKGNENIIYNIYSQNSNIIIKNEYFNEANLVVEIIKKTYNNICHDIEKLYIEVKEEKLLRKIIDFKFDYVMKLSKIHICAYIKLIEIRL